MTELYFLPEKAISALYLHTQTRNGRCEPEIHRDPSPGMLSVHVLGLPDLQPDTKELWTNIVWKTTWEERGRRGHRLQRTAFPAFSVLAPGPKEIASPQTQLSESQFTAEWALSTPAWETESPEWWSAAHRVASQKERSQIGTGDPGSHLPRPRRLGHPALQTLSHIPARQCQPEFRLCLEKCHPESQMCQPYYHYQQTS